ncbi:unnamed protein product [Paramecium octaurelia]|uniref:Uncharacterized protein n=1 Tax=Paramecium octaurelia TaxID=43137 RepID=A0A8S1XSS2_PAROT|nr:unnamed protein product [Paramecium octaurelia]
MLIIFNIQKIQFTKKESLKVFDNEYHQRYQGEFNKYKCQGLLHFNFDLNTKSFPIIQVQLPFVSQEKIRFYSHIYVYVLIIRLRIKEFRTYVLMNNIKQFNFIIENRINNSLLKSLYQVTLQDHKQGKQIL